MFMKTHAFQETFPTEGSDQENVPFNDLDSPDFNSNPVPRRAFLSGAIGAAFLAAVGGQRAEAQDSGGPMDGLLSTGFFQVPTTEESGIIAVLIGLLLPAVQKVREAQVAFADSAGMIYPLKVAPVGGTNAQAVKIEIRNKMVSGKRVLSLTGVGVEALDIPTADGLLIGLLLPAVRTDGRSAGMHAGGVQVLMGDGSVRFLLPYIEQDNLYRFNDSAAGPEFIAPFRLGRGERGLIGLLLPAVQSLVQGFRLQFYNSAGKLVAKASVSPGRTVRARFFDIFFDEIGALKIVPKGGLPLPLTAQPGTDNILIGLLLPAVQKVREIPMPVGPLGGSLEIPNTAVGLHPSALP